MSDAYHAAQEVQAAKDRANRKARSLGAQLPDTDYLEVLKALWEAGLAMTDDEPRGRGHGLFADILPGDVDAMLLAIRGLPIDARCRIAAVILGVPAHGLLVDHAYR